MDGTDDRSDPQLRSARALLELTLEFADRAQVAEAALLAAFSARAAPLAAGVGSLDIDSDEDERLSLRDDGALTGEVLDDDSGTWLTIESPEEVARYYDPTDVFLDLADALVERFPELGDEPTDVAATPDGAPAEPARAEELVPDAGGQPAAGPADRATLRMLEDLRRAGALSDAEFERLRSQLES